MEFIFILKDTSLSRYDSPLQCTTFLRFWLKVGVGQLASDKRTQHFALEQQRSCALFFSRFERVCLCSTFSSSLGSRPSLP